MFPRVIIILLLDIYFFLQDDGTKREGDIRVIQEDLVETTGLMMDTISKMMDDHILDSTKELPLSVILPKGESFCLPYSTDPDLLLYCRFEQNPLLWEPIKNDTCQSVLKDYQPERWYKESNMTKAVIKKCLHQQRKTLIFGHLNNIPIPFDFVSNKYRKVQMLHNFINYMQFTLKE